MVGRAYDTYYALKYPDGRVIDISGGAGDTETWTFYSHTGVNTGMSFGRQHLAASQGRGLWQLGFKTGHTSMDYGGQISVQKIRVRMSRAQSEAFRAALEAASKVKGGHYMPYHKDSYTYIDECLKRSTGYSAADFHLNAGLFNWGG